MSSDNFTESIVEQAATSIKDLLGIPCTKRKKCRARHFGNKLRLTPDQLAPKAPGSLDVPASQERTQATGAGIPPFDGRRRLFGVTFISAGSC
jgi:hypothetical protein